jgi:hypothetical protein
MGFPIIFEHMDACGVWRGKEVKVPAITAAAAILVSQGADQILIPTPSSYETERAAEGIERLPKERRNLVKVVDGKGDVLRRVRSYLEPLVAQAKKWPETAFVGFAEDFLYQVALGTDFKAGVLGHSVGTVRDFVPIVDPQSFRGEARFRLAEIVSVICSYEPNRNDHGAYRFDLVPSPESSAQIWDLIENAEFGSLVAMAGRIGYLRHPAVAFRRLRSTARKFFKKPETAKLFALAASAAELAGAKSIIEKAKSIASLVNIADRAAFCPPFIDLGSAQIGVYRLALADAYAHATPPDGAILVFEHSRGGKVSHSWLNVGEELKLQKEEHDIDSSRAKLLEARSALKRFI